MHRVKTVLALKSENDLKVITHIHLDSSEPWPQRYSSTILPYEVTTADCEANTTAQTADFPRGLWREVDGYSPSIWRG